MAMGEGVIWLLTVSTVAAFFLGLGTAYMALWDRRTRIWLKGYDAGFLACDQQDERGWWTPIPNPADELALDDAWNSSTEED